MVQRSAGEFWRGSALCVYRSGSGLLPDLRRVPKALEICEKEPLELDKEAAEVVADQEQTAEKESPRRRITGIVLIILSLVPAVLFDNDFGGALMFVFVGAGVFLLVYNSSRKGLFKDLRKAQERAANIRSMNRGMNEGAYSGAYGAYSDGTYRAGAGAAGAYGDDAYRAGAGATRRYVSTGRSGKGEKKEKYYYSDRNLRTLMPIYWEVVTCVYFGFSFLTGSWGVSWLIWIAAVAVKKAIENRYGEPM